MKILKTIKDKDLGSDLKDPIFYTQERKASRAVVSDKNKNIALLYIKNKGYHKLPGGGSKEGEDILDTLKREVTEEIGCKIVNIKEIGIVEEFRNYFSLHQLSFCFTADLDGEKGVSQFEADEIEDGFETVWMGIHDAIKTLESERELEHYEGKFINVRDLLILKEARDSILD